MLVRMFGGTIDSARDAQGRVFIDRDGTHFSIILQWLRNGPSFKLSNSLSEDQLHDLQLECDFYQLDGLKELITAATKDEGVFLGKSRGFMSLWSIHLSHFFNLVTRKVDAREFAWRKSMHWVCRCGRCTLL
jgi:BTB/POZ domain